MVGAWFCITFFIGLFLEGLCAFSFLFRWCSRTAVWLTDLPHSLGAAVASWIQSWMFLLQSMIWMSVLMTLALLRNLSSVQNSNSIQTDLTPPQQFSSICAPLTQDVFWEDCGVSCGHLRWLGLYYGLWLQQNHGEICKFSVAGGSFPAILIKQ